MHGSGTPGLIGRGFLGFGWAAGGGFGGFERLWRGGLQLDWGGRVPEVIALGEGSGGWFRGRMGLMIGVSRVSVKIGRAVSDARNTLEVWVIWGKMDHRDREICTNSTRPATYVLLQRHWLRELAIVLTEWNLAQCSGGFSGLWH